MPTRPSPHVVSMPDIVIVGAGLIGAAVAYEAARRGLGVLVLERADRPAEGATRWSQAGLSWLSAANKPEVAALCLEGLARHRTLGDELGADTGFRPLSLLGLAPDAAALARLSELVDRGREIGFEGKTVGADDLRRLEPGLAEGAAVGGVLCRGGHADPVLLTRAWIGAATRLGATVRYSTDVRDVLIVNGRCRGVVTDRETIEANQIVVASGAWTRPLLRRSGFAAPILHTHAEVLETAPLPPTLAHFVGVGAPIRADLERAMGAPSLRPSWDAGADQELLPTAVQFGAVQFADGRLLLGQVSRAVPGFRGTPNPAGEALIRAAARTFFPRLADLPARLHGRPVAISADRGPVAGPLPEMENVYVAAGYDSPVIYTPALAARLASALAGEPVPELESFSPARFATSDER